MRLLSAIALALSVLLVLWVGLDPDFHPPSWLGDKLQHAVAFFAITLLAVGVWPRVSLWLMLAGISVFAGAIEIIQWGMAQGREADWIDLGVGIASAGATLLVVGLARALRATLSA